MSLGPKIKELRDAGYTYKEISKELGCSNSTIGYHLGGETQKLNYKLRNRKNYERRHPYVGKYKFFISILVHEGNQKNNPNTLKRTKIYNKIRRFSAMSRQHYGYAKANFTVDDVIDKFTETPTCYLTGRKIDIYDTRSYHFDHIIPRKCGGSSDIENLGICCREANLVKNEFTPEELFEICKEILVHNGYSVNQPNSA